MALTTGGEVTGGEVTNGYEKGVCRVCPNSTSLSHPVTKLIQDDIQ